MLTLTFPIQNLSLEQLETELSQNNIGLNASAQKLLTDPRLVLSEHSHLQTIKIMTVADLNLQSSAILPNIFSAAQKQGLQLCSLESAIYLRLFWKNQPESNDPAMHRQKAPDSSVTVASPIISTDPYQPKGFYLRNVNQKLWLRGYICDDVFVWQPEDQFAFQI